MMVNNSFFISNKFGHKKLFEIIPKTKKKCSPLSDTCLKAEFCRFWAVGASEGKVPFFSIFLDEIRSDDPDLQRSRTSM